MKFKILIVLVIALAFIYWRGTKAILSAKGYDCNWHAVYSVCLTDSKKVKDAQAPQFMDVIKAGIKF